MTLYLIGLGLNDEKDISVKGLEIVKKADFVFLENYTSKLSCRFSDLEKFYGKKIIPANRKMVEEFAETEILSKAKDNEVAFLVIGDAMCGTTHTDLITRARKLKIKTEVVHNASVISAVCATGLQVYKFGKVASIPFAQQGYMPETPYNVLKDNQKIGAHTLLLLDLKPDSDEFLGITDAIHYLLKIELKRNEKVFTSATHCVGCARLGAKSEKIVFGTAKELLREDFGAPPYCLIVPGKMHFMEEEFLKQFA